MKKIAFVCYGNSCRSQIAEGLSKVMGKGLFEAYSAGTNPLGKATHEVYEVMAKRGIDISDQYSKGLNKIPLDEMDYVITMGCRPADSICPIHFSGEKIDWDIPDPYGNGINEFERTTSLIEKNLTTFIEKHF